MKAKKKYIVLGALALLITIVTGIGWVVASGPLGGFLFDGRPPFFGRGFHHGFHGGNVHEKILGHLDERITVLNLTDVQKEKYKEIRTNIAAHLKEGMLDRRELMEELHTEILKENPNIETMVASIKERITIMSQSISEHLDLFVEFYAILDDDQKKMITDKIRERAKGCPGW